MAFFAADGAMARKTMEHTLTTGVLSSEPSARFDGTLLAIGERHDCAPPAVIPRITREKAVRLGVRTGWMPNVDLIWRWQAHEGYRSCFGEFQTGCNPDCRWRKDCAQVRNEPVAAATSLRLG
ncbi:MAG: hypothetical protein HZA51_05930 [Planctomycetes bacterium]|nr:hypothetical protein [Planctomycetota bacterium]